MRTQLLRRDNANTFETRRADLRPQSFDATARTIEAVIATTSAVSRRDARGTFSEVLDIAGADLSALSGAHVLNNHRQDGVENVLGVVEEGWREGDTIVARIRLSDRPEVASIVSDVERGTIRNLSVGYEVSGWRDGTDASGNRTRTAIAWRIREVSFVAVAADPRARTRAASIRELARRAGIDTAATDAMVDSGVTLEQARAAMLDQLLTRSALPIRSAHNAETLDNPDFYRRTVGEALHASVTPGARVSGAARQFVGMMPTDIARDVLQRNGVNVTGMSRPVLIERALTTSDYPLILADTVGRTLRAAYAAPASGIRTLARQTTAADFRAKSSLMLDSSGLTLDKVNEHGEFKSGALAEAGESYAIDSFGRIISISRKALVNDDLGAFNDLSRRMGQAAVAFEAQFLVNLLISGSGLGPLMRDGQRLFHSTHGNVSGSGAAPSETTLSAARLAMRGQTGPGGGLIDVVPTHLVVPSALETAAEKLLTQIQATQTSDVNPFAKLALVVEPRLISATRWYLVAAAVDGLEFAHLAGAPGPQIESKVGFEIDGISMKVRLDFGAGWVEHRGWYTNAGA